MLNQYIPTAFGLFTALVLIQPAEFVTLVLNGSVSNSRYFQVMNAFNSLGHKN
jgi:hypothetical protein